MCGWFGGEHDSNCAWEHWGHFVATIPSVLVRIVGLRLRLNFNSGNHFESGQDAHQSCGLAGTIVSVYVKLLSSANPAIAAMQSLGLTGAEDEGPNRSPVICPLCSTRDLVPLSGP